MQRLVAAELVNVVESALGCLVGNMQADTPVDAKNEEVEVVTQSHASTQGHLLEELTKTESAVDIADSKHLIVHVEILESPHVAGIEEHGSMQIAEESLAILQIGLELDITILHDVRELPALLMVTRKAPRTNATQGERPDAIGTTHVETLAERHFGAISEAVAYTCTKMTHKLRMSRYLPIFRKIGLNLHKLRIGVLEHLLVLQKRDLYQL